MTQFPHDQFIKDYLPELLGQYGQATTGVELAIEVKEIDVLFIPNQQVPTDILGLLAELVQTSCILEVYRNPTTPHQIRTCISKLVEVQTTQIKEAQKNKQSILESEITKLWILTPTLSEAILNSCGANQKQLGVYLLPEILKTGIVVIHQLPITSETLWLRILGKGTTQQKAIRDLEALPNNHPYKENVLELVYKLFNILKISRRTGQTLEQEDIETMRRIDALYEEKIEQLKRLYLEQGLEQGREQGREQGLEQGREQGVKQGEVNLTIRLIKRLLGEIPPEIQLTIEKLQTPSLEALAESLQDFKTLEDLTNWLAIDK